MVKAKAEGQSSNSAGNTAIYTVQMSYSIEERRMGERLQSAVSSYAIQMGYPGTNTWTWWRLGEVPAT